MTIVTKNVRIRLSEQDWERLRVQAAQNGCSVTRLVNYFVRVGVERRSYDNYLHGKVL